MMSQAMTLLAGVNWCTDVNALLSLLLVVIVHLFVV